MIFRCRRCCFLYNGLTIPHNCGGAWNNIFDFRSIVQCKLLFLCQHFYVLIVALHSLHMTLSQLKTCMNMMKTLTVPKSFIIAAIVFFSLFISKINPDHLIRHCLDVSKYNREFCESIPIYLYLLPFGCTLILSRRNWLCVVACISLLGACAVSIVVLSKVTCTLLQRFQYRYVQYAIIFGIGNVAAVVATIDETISICHWYH